MKKFLVAIIFVICLATGARAQQITGSTKLTVAPTQSSSQGLLSGATVNSSNQPSVTVPAGWSLVLAQGFEGNLNGMEQLNGSVSTAQSHTGSHSMGGLYDGDGAIVADNLVGLPTFSSDIYLSYWDWEDSNALIPQELFVAVLNNTAQGLGPPEQDFGWDWQGTPGSSRTCWSMVNITDTTDHTDVGPIDEYGNYVFTYTPSLCINAGSWRQYEVWFHPNTVHADGTSPSGFRANTDGFIRLYVNGQLTNQMDAAHGSGNMNGIYGPGGPTPHIGSGNSQSLLEIGGVITAFCDANANTRANPFSQCPANAPTPFHRYIDDIIVIKK